MSNLGWVVLSIVRPLYQTYYRVQQTSLLCAHMTCCPFFQIEMQGVRVKHGRVITTTPTQSWLGGDRTTAKFPFWDCHYIPCRRRS
jgi:hypothetical protein